MKKGLILAILLVFIFSTAVIAATKNYDKQYRMPAYSNMPPMPYGNYGNMPPMYGNRPPMPYGNYGNRPPMYGNYGQVPPPPMNPPRAYGNMSQMYGNRPPMPPQGVMYGNRPPMPYGNYGNYGNSGQNYPVTLPLYDKSRPVVQ